MSHNTWIHRVARVAIVRPLAKTPVTPNQVTAVRLAVGITAAAWLAVGHEPCLNYIAGLFVFGMLLDRADGDLARLTGRTSPRGHIYDLISDAASNALIFVGLGFALRNGSFGLWAIPMGVAAGLSVAAILWAVMRVEDAQGARAAELGGIAGFDPDDAMLIVPVSIWLGGEAILLTAAAVGAPLFALLFLRKFRAVLFR
ncbi:MAG: CDP-alcohol phosphatidyltransferase family protein [Alphaproteobacteria bacterium]|nr:CDP-alcohol phosphatidyltransferase family protein [Alphaproteobacteria bacterium]